VAPAAGTPPRSVYDCPALALVLIEPPAGGPHGRPDRTRRRGEAARLRERLKDAWFDFAVRDESLLPRPEAGLGGGRPPRCLAALGARSPDDAAGLQRRLGVVAPDSVWSMWTRLAATGSSSGEAAFLYVVVMSPPEFLGKAGADEFERYYAGRHLAEIAEEIGYLRGSLFAAADLPGERWAPGPGRYLAVYEAADQQALHRQAARVRAMPGRSFDGAPPAWAARQVAWRAAFRPGARPAGPDGSRFPPATRVESIMEVSFTDCK
jgi:hypothetical protein